MRNIFIFPFTAEQLPLLRYQADFCSDVNFVPIIAPSRKIPDANVAVLDNSSNVYYTAVDWKYANADDVFCFTSGDGSIASFEYGLTFAKKVISAGHDVEIHLNRAEYLRLNSISSEFLGLDKIRIARDITEVNGNTPTEKARLNSIHVPIIAVGSIVADNNKKEICLALTKYYQSKGKKVICIFSDSMYQYLGMHVLNYERMFDDGVDLMIHRINSYFNTVQQTTKCDVIICDIPGGLFKYSRELIDSAGVFSYIISQAIDSQKMICCVPLSYNPIDYYKMVADAIHKKFDVNEVLFHMSNYLVESKQLPIAERMPGCFVEKSDYESILQFINSTETFVYNLRDDVHLGKLLAD